MAKPEQSTWRHAQQTDLTAIHRIGVALHPSLPERPDVIAEKLHLFPPGCVVLCEASRIVGYVLSHPWRLNDIPPLDTLLHSLPTDPDCLFVHDVALLQEARGRGAVAGLLAHLTTIARERRLSHMALVSVYGTHVLWSRLGFTITDAPQIRGALQSYGPGARYMVRVID